MQKYLEPVEDGLPLLEVGSWAKIKLDYLARYIDAFNNSMKKKWERNYIDLLAGPGKDRIRNSQDIILGSPILALTTRYPFTRYYFGDISAVSTQALEKRCSHSPLNNSVKIETGDCNSVVDKFLPDLKKHQKNSLNFAFLDPWALELHWNTVEKLARLPRMDIILYYPQYGLTRSMGVVYKSPEQNIVDQFFGGREWREIYAKWQHRGIHRRLIDLYKSRLQRLGYVHTWRGDQDVGDEPEIRNLKRNAPLYHLIFASKHPLGHKLWRDIVRRDVHGQLKLL